jgi:peptidoglycan hydrolase CwlO-like protein
MSKAAQRDPATQEPAQDLQGEVNRLQAALKASERDLAQAQQTIAAFQLTIRVQAKVLAG